MLKRIIFGTASLGSKSNYKESIEILNYVYSLGIRNFDSGPLYGACQAHKIINDFSKNKFDILVSSKFLSRIHNPLREIGKLIFVRSGYNGYQNLTESRKLYEKAANFKLKPEDINNFIVKQNNLYPNVKFDKWFFHSPSNIFLETISAYNYGLSIKLSDKEKIINNKIIQTDANSIFNFNLKKLQAEKIFVNRIHTYAISNKLSTLKIYNRLLGLDKRINIIVGTRKVKILKEIKKNVLEIQNN